MRLTQQAQLDALPTGSRVLRPDRMIVCRKRSDGLWEVEGGNVERPSPRMSHTATSGYLAFLEPWLLDATATTTDDLDRLLACAQLRDVDGNAWTIESHVCWDVVGDPLPLYEMGAHLPAAILWPGEA